MVWYICGNVVTCEHREPSQFSHDTLRAAVRDQDQVSSLFLAKSTKQSGTCFVKHQWYGGMVRTIPYRAIQVYYMVYGTTCPESCDLPNIS